jgi:hypothetical protein
MMIQLARPSGLQPTLSIGLKSAGGRMRPFFLAALMTLLIGVPAAGAAARDGWFVRVCPAKTEAGRIHLTFSGGRQGYSWSWTRGRTPDEIDLPAGLTPWHGSPCAAARFRRRATSKLTPMSVSDSAITLFSAWNSMITKITKGIGMIPMIVPAKSEYQYLT